MCFQGDVLGNRGTAAAFLPLALISACAFSRSVALEMPRAGAYRADPREVGAYPLCVHEELIVRALADVFSADALDVIIDACRSMDDPISALDPLNHFDNGKIEASARRMEERYRAIRRAEDPVESLELFGKIIHAPQDFISHSNYVEIMVEIQRGARARIEAPPPISIVSVFEDSEAALMADVFEVPASYEPLLRQAIASGRLTSGQVCLLDYPFDFLSRIPLLGDLTDVVRDILSVPGTILAAIPGVGDATSCVIPVLRSHHNMSKDHEDLRSAEVELEDGRTVYELCLETAAAQTRYEFDRHFIRSIRLNSVLREIDWKRWQNPKKTQAER